MNRYLVLLVLAVLATACGDTTAPPVQEVIAGSYSGVMSGVSEGVQLSATFTLTLTQDGGNLGGSYGISGTLSDSQSSVPVQGTGAISGTIDEGSNPSVNFTVTPGPCPNQAETFSGTYDSTNQRITATGDVVMFDNNCDTLLVYPMLLSLSR